LIPVDFSSYLFISFFDIPGMLTARDAIDYSIFQSFCLKKYSHCFSSVFILTGDFDYSPFCVQANIIKLVGLKNGGRLSPIILVTFAGTQNGE
jgi:hypothetical protein